nr:MAG TPA_asm: hypothetical protein [Caudoviricetes sp.]
MSCLVSIQTLLSICTRTIPVLYLQNRVLKKNNQSYFADGMIKKP